MCYSSMNDKVCTKERCTYWHMKGTNFAPESTSRYKAPSRYSLGEFPSLPARRGRSPVRREQEEGWRQHPRKEEQNWREREERRGREEDHEVRRRREKSREQKSYEEKSREQRSTEESNRRESAPFLDLAQLVRQEVQRAVLALLPQPVASGGAAGGLAVPTAPNWAELLGRRTSN